MPRSARVSSLPALKLESSSFWFLKSQFSFSSLEFREVSLNFCYLLRCDGRCWIASFSAASNLRSFVSANSWIFELSILRSFESSNSKPSSAGPCEPSDKTLTRFSYNRKSSETICRYIRRIWYSKNSRGRFTIKATERRHVSTLMTRRRRKYRRRVKQGPDLSE